MQRRFRMTARSTWIALASLILIGVAIAPSPAGAESYLERKDREALGAVSRALEQIDRDPSLFDGKAIPEGADLARVGALRDQLARHLDVCRRSFVDVSAASLRKPEVDKLHQRYLDLDAYAKALAPVYKSAAADAERAGDVKKRADAAAHDAGVKACNAFHRELYADPSDRHRIDRLVALAGGSQKEHWSSAEEGTKHMAALARGAEICAKPEYADIGTGCRYIVHGADDDKICAAMKRGNELAKLAATNFAAFHAANFKPGRTAENFAGQYEGFLEIEGDTTWKKYFDAQGVREMYKKQIGPVFAQAGVTNLDDSPVFVKITEHFTALEAKVRELAPTWKVPGSPCAGVACSVAKTTTRLYGTVLRLQQDESTWKIAKNDLGLPTHRWKAGFVLLQVKGDPFCQLRSWTVTETYAGGGRYQPTSNATLGYVRWQSCK